MTKTQISPNTLVGTVSHGTLRTDDLISAFMPYLEQYWPEKATEINDRILYPFTVGKHGGGTEKPFRIGRFESLEAAQLKIANLEETDPEGVQRGDYYLDAPEDMEEYRSTILNEEIFEAMDEISPAGFHFGSHEGDGSDFGFWENEPDEDEVGLPAWDYE